MQGKFIVFEGIDGAGKTSQLKRLQTSLETLGHTVYKTQEPSDLPVGKLIRSVLSKEIVLPAESLAHLFAADRLDHLENRSHGMLSKLDQGHFVICDRYYYSSLAYHSLDVDMHWVYDLNKFAVERLKADLTIFLDIDPAVSMQRIQKGRTETELFEKQDILTQVRNNYVKAFELFPTPNLIRIDANRPETEIAEVIWSAVTELCQEE